MREPQGERGLSEDATTARLGIYLAIVFTTFSPLGFVLSTGLMALAAGQMAALAFTVPEAGPAGGVPESWRPWATSDWLHLTLLLAGLVAAFTAV